MDYRIDGAGKVGFGTILAFSRQNHRRLTLALFAAITIVGTMIVIRVVQNATIAQQITAGGLEGTWELESLDGTAIGEQTTSPILSQRMSLRDGTIRGETRVRANTDASTSSMPFPDESVTRVVASADETAVRVLWDGTYQLDDNQQLALHVGKAVYFVKVAWKRDRNVVELNQDTILTIHGAATYRRAISSQKPR